MSKLTLNAEPSVISKAKKLAQQRGTSVSMLFSQIVLSLPQKNDGQKQYTIGPITRKASGIAKLPTGKSYSQLIDKAVMEKHGNRLK